MKVGTKSVLFGAHQFFIHPLFVAAAWSRLYGFPTDIRLWAAFILHDIGYLGKPNMDGPEGETHPEFGARVMHRLFDDRDIHAANGACKCISWEGTCQECTALQNEWYDFSLYHSRFYAKRDRKPFSRLCVADKLGMALEPWWLYLPRVIVTRELWEFMDIAGGQPIPQSKETSIPQVVSKYTGEPEVGDFPTWHQVAAAGGSRYQQVRAWHRRCAHYMRAWAYEHQDGRADTWTPEAANA